MAIHGSFYVPVGWGFKASWRLLDGVSCGKGLLFGRAGGLPAVPLWLHRDLVGMVLTKEALLSYLPRLAGFYCVEGYGFKALVWSVNPTRRIPLPRDQRNPYQHPVPITVF